MKFTTPCFISKNTPGLRKKLEDLGYTCFAIEDDNCIHCGPLGYWVGNWNIFFNSKGTIDAGTNEALFLALAALREDSDKHQLFICTKGCLNNNEGDIEKCVIEELNNPNYRKLTPTELIEHFKNNE